MHGPNCKIGTYCTVGRRLQEVNVLGGLILPVWGTIEKALAKQVGCPAATFISHYFFPNQEFGGLGAQFLGHAFH